MIFDSTLFCPTVQRSVSPEDVIWRMYIFWIEVRPKDLLKLMPVGICLSLIHASRFWDIILNWLALPDSRLWRQPFNGWYGSSANWTDVLLTPDIRFASWCLILGNSITRLVVWIDSVIGRQVRRSWDPSQGFQISFKSLAQTEGPPKWQIHQPQELVTCPKARTQYAICQSSRLQLY